MYMANAKILRWGSNATCIPLIRVLCFALGLREVLSLYSTATQKYWRWGYALGQPPNVKICVGSTNMLVSKNAKVCVTPNAKPKICVTPNANQWNIGYVGSTMQNFALAVYISFCADFIRF